jgi:uncharacterized membrane protein YcaP (DUF421 family)
MGIAAVAVRALTGYLFLLVLLRATGKRSISQSSPFDFVMALILGDLIDDCLWAEAGFAQFAVAAGTLVVVQTAVATAQARSRALHAWITGEPPVVLRDGRPVRDALRRARVREDELAAHLRLHGVERERWDDLRLARLEAGGVVSIEKTGPAREVERHDLAERRR